MLVRRSVLWSGTTNNQSLRSDPGEFWPESLLMRMAIYAPTADFQQILTFKVKSKIFGKLYHLYLWASFYCKLYTLELDVPDDFFLQNWRGLIPNKSFPKFGPVILFASCYGCFTTGHYRSFFRLLQIVVEDRFSCRICLKDRTPFCLPTADLFLPIFYRTPCPYGQI